MRAKFSPSLANLYMGWWEEIFLFSHNNPFSEQIDWYCRFIDDLIFVWKGPVHEIDLFMCYLNDNHLNLEISYNYHFEQNDYLDLSLTGHTQNGLVSTKTYRKKCAVNSLLCATSCHPPHTIKALPIGEFLKA